MLLLLIIGYIIILFYLLSSYRNLAWFVLTWLGVTCRRGALLWCILQNLFSQSCSCWYIYPFWKLRGMICHYKCNQLNRPFVKNSFGRIAGILMRATSWLHRFLGKFNCEICSAQLCRILLEFMSPSAKVIFRMYFMDIAKCTQPK